MKNGAVVMLVFDILKKIGHGFGRFVGVQLNRDVAHVGGNFDLGGLLGLAETWQCKAGPKRNRTEEFQRIVAKGGVRHVFSAMCAYWSRWW